MLPSTPVHLSAAGIPCHSAYYNDALHMQGCSQATNAGSGVDSCQRRRCFQGRASVAAGSDTVLDHELRRELEPGHRCREVLDRLNDWSDPACRHQHLPGQIHRRDLPAITVRAPVTFLLPDHSFHDARPCPDGTPFHPDAFHCLGRGKHVSTVQIVDYSIGITASILVTVLALVYSRRALLKIQVCGFSRLPCFICASCCGLSTWIFASSTPRCNAHADMDQT